MDRLRRSVFRGLDQQRAEPGLGRLAGRAAVPGHRRGDREINRQRHDFDLGGGSDLLSGALRHRGDEIGGRERRWQRRGYRDALLPTSRAAGLTPRAGRYRPIWFAALPIIRSSQR